MSDPIFAAIGIHHAAELAMTEDAPSNQDTLGLLRTVPTTLGGIRALVDYARTDEVWASFSVLSSASASWRGSPLKKWSLSPRAISK